MDGTEIPIPPSVNGLWRAFRRMYRNGTRGKVQVCRSKAYVSWLQEAVLILRFQMAKAQTYPVRVSVTIHRGKGWRINRDLDNTYKAISDALVHSERLADDSSEHVAEIVMRFGENRKLAVAVVVVEPLAQAA